MIKHIKIMVTAATMLAASANLHAQEYTYAHDPTKMNQFLMQETGAGSIPDQSELYYTIMHNQYKKSIASTNKMSYRTATYEASYQQVQYADSIRKRLESRAKEESFNMADRQLDVTWLAEHSKIENALSKYSNNLTTLASCRTNAEEMSDWRLYPQMWSFAIDRARNAYMANSERQKEFLSIYNDIVTKNARLVNRILLLKSLNGSKDILSAHANNQQKYSQCATAAYNRWRERAWDVKSNNTNLKTDSNNPQQ